MPVGVERKGVRYYDGVEKAVCRNCKEEDKFNNCCEKQKERSRYENLESPDYAFENDITARNQYLDIFTKKNISIL